jgi:hypothetical protein
MSDSNPIAVLERTSLIVRDRRVRAGILICSGGIAAYTRLELALTEYPEALLAEQALVLDLRVTNSSTWTLPAACRCRSCRPGKPTETISSTSKRSWLRLHKRGGKCHVVPCDPSLKDYRNA